MSRWIEPLANLLFPPTCWMCEQSQAEKPFDCLCKDCLPKLIEDSHTTCPRCASTIGPNSASQEGCPRCSKYSYQFEGVVRLGPYENLLREAILLSKSQAYESLAEILGERLSDKLKSMHVDANWNLVIPIPLYWWRRWTRGYNQAEAIARGLSLRLCVPLARNVLIRVKHTPKQTTLSPTQRFENLRGAFAVRKQSNLRGLRILLIDDVLTTGATANEASRQLRQAGAAQVQVAVLAHR